MKKTKKGLTKDDMLNIITDMTMNGAPKEELEKAIKQSMDVIDSEKQGFWKKHKKIIITGVVVTGTVVATGFVAYRFGIHKGFEVGNGEGRYNILKWMDYVEPTTNHVELYETYHKNHPEEFHILSGKTINKLVKKES